MIVVSRDYEGLRIAALELFEEARTTREQERRFRNIDLDRTVNAEQLIEQAMPKRTLSDGYYSRVRYLLWLERTQEAGVNFKNLQVSEVEGVGAVNEARSEFKSKYPPCPRCGFPNTKFMPRCGECGAELQSKAKH